MNNAEPPVNLRKIVFETTPECNLDCRYCYNIWKRPGATRPGPAVFRESLRTLKALFRQAQVFHVTFSGGEPFMAERFPELVLACRMRGKTVSLITNGCSATDAEYRVLLDVGVGLFEIPALSYRSTVHDGITRTRGSWEKATRSIRYLLKLGASVVAVVVLTRHNVADLEPTLHWLKVTGVDQVMLNRFNIGGSGISEWEELSLRPSALHQAFEVAERAAVELQLSITANVCTPHCVLDPRDFPHIPAVSCGLRLENRPVTLDAAGNLRLCNHSSVVLGNIHRTPLRQILQHIYVKRFAEAIPKACIGCSQFPACRGGCRAAGEQVWGDLEQGDPLLRLRRQTSRVSAP